MLPLISFETGRKTQTQSSGQPDELRQQMEVWFYPRIETAAERPTPRAQKGKDFLHRRSSRAHQEAFCLLTRTYHRSRVIGQVPVLGPVSCSLPLCSVSSWKDLGTDRNQSRMLCSATERPVGS